MTTYYVNIEGLSDETLVSFGFRLIHEDQNFKLYRHYHGDDHIVDKARPRLFVDDANVAMEMGSEAIIIDP